MLLSSATKCLIKVDGGCDGIHAVADLAHLSREQGVLSCDDIQVICAGILIEFLRGIECLGKRFHLLVYESLHFACHIDVVHCQIHLVAGLDDCLLEVVCGYFHLSLRDLVLCTDSTVLEERLGKACNSCSDEYARIDGSSKTVGELTARRDGELREEIAIRDVLVVESGCQFVLGIADVRTAVKNRDGQACGANGRRLEGGQRVSVDVELRLAKECRKCILEGVDAVIDNNYMKSSRLLDVAFRSIDPTIAQTQVAQFEAAKAEAKGLYKYSDVYEYDHKNLVTLKRHDNNNNDFTYTFTYYRNYSYRSSLLVNHTQSHLKPHTDTQKGGQLDHSLIERLKMREGVLVETTRKVKAELKKAPKGRLKFVRRKTHVEYYWVEPKTGRRRYITKNNLPFAMALAQKSYNKQALKLADVEISASDFVTPELSSELEDDTEIKINRGIKIYLTSPHHNTHTSTS